MCQFKTFLGRTCTDMSDFNENSYTSTLMMYSNFNKRYSYNAEGDQKKKENLRIRYKPTSSGWPLGLGVNLKIIPVFSKVPAPCTHIWRLHL